MGRRRTKRVRVERDRHLLYELSVQCPEADVQFLDRVYKKRNDRRPRSLREDFCGTAALSVEWVKHRKANTAVGVDLDAETLEWGRKRHIVPLGDSASRVTLIKGNVLEVGEPKADIVAAMNFSYFTFKTRDLLRRYFEQTRSVLEPGGVLVLDIFGGHDAQSLDEEEKEFEGFNYYWDQEKFDPVTNETLYHIHFKFDEGGWMKKAFTYDWRMWSVIEVRELLAEAGYRKSEVYWEGTERDTGDGNGVFREVEKAETCPGWIAYIVASDR